MEHISVIDPVDFLVCDQFNPIPGRRPIPHTHDGLSAGVELPGERGDAGAGCKSLEPDDSDNEARCILFSGAVQLEPQTIMPR